MNRKSVSLNNGLDFTYRHKDTIMELYIKGSNSRRDYIKNFKAWPRKKFGTRKYHPEWLKSALELGDWLLNYQSEGNVFTLVKIEAHSMGGAVAAIFNELYRWQWNIRVKAWNSPKCGSRIGLVHADHRSDLVHHLPIFYPRYTGIQVKYGDLWESPLKAHTEKPVGFIGS